ncbi:amidase [Paraburkholderia sp. Cy-641]|uniref:amidase n=1 Tax=Paraburkholderia sp. Cy-641 TaxID=2608337 RepID=UPI001421AC58|nr:amidase [Paraburkholderia sp. Cy-641]NIF78636.1 amidase [Paraburkholderia sp. Cy-641]
MIHEAHLLTVSAAAQQLAAGSLTSEQLVRSCLERIQDRNPVVQALVIVDPDKALHDARKMDRQVYRPHLHGIPFVVKDIIETADFPTEYGSPIYAGHRPQADSACVSQFRGMGGILVGKAATSEFATRKPAMTRNPLRLTHTPGGSSSGSAAAVADFMVPFALGTQTTGSIARPASYCGVVGFKPTFDLFNRAGLKPTSQSLDTIGLLTRTIRDAYLLTFNDPDFDSEIVRCGTPRFAICRSSQWNGVEQSFFDTLTRLQQALMRANQPVRELNLDADLESLIAGQEKIFVYEAAHSLAHERQNHAELMSDILRNRLAVAEQIDQDLYLQLRSAVERARYSVDELFQDNDVLIYPATEGSAEEGLDYSGSPRLGALWTLLHLPTIVIPFGRSANGMPFGLQLVGRFGQDRLLLAAAELLSRYIDPAFSSRTVE